MIVTCCSSVREVFVGCWDLGLLLLRYVDLKMVFGNVPLEMFKFQLIIYIYIVDLINNIRLPFL